MTRSGGAVNSLVQNLSGGQSPHPSKTIFLVKVSLGLLYRFYGVGLFSNKVRSVSSREPALHAFLIHKMFYTCP